MRAAWVAVLLVACGQPRPWCDDLGSPTCEPGRFAACPMEAPGMLVSLAGAGSCGFALVPRTMPRDSATCSADTVSCTFGGAPVCVRLVPSTTPDESEECDTLFSDCITRGGTSSCHYVTDADGNRTGEVIVDP